jgi:hypothetical protein
LRQFVNAACDDFSTGERVTVAMSRNRLLLLIAGLAVLVAIGILTS